MSFNSKKQKIIKSTKLRAETKVSQLNTCQNVLPSNSHKQVTRPTLVTKKNQPLENVCGAELKGLIHFKQIPRSLKVAMKVLWVNVSDTMR